MNEPAVACIKDFIALTTRASVPDEARMLSRTLNTKGMAFVCEAAYGAMGWPLVIIPHGAFPGQNARCPAAAKSKKPLIISGLVPL